MSSNQPSRSGSLLSKILLVVAGLLTALVGAEVAYRIWLRIDERPYDQAAIRGELQGLLDESNQLRSGLSSAQPQDGSRQRCVHPFLGFDVVESLEQIAADQQRFAEGKDARTFDILLLGGSVAAGFGNFGRARLRELLREDPRFAQVNIQLLSYARAAYKQPQQLITLSYLMNLGIRPDAVINLDGFNEVAISNENAHHGVHPLQPSIGEWASRNMTAVRDPQALEHLVELRVAQSRVKERADWALSSGLLWSSIGGTLVIRWVELERQRQVAVQGKAVERMTGRSSSPVVRGPAFEGELEEVLDLAVQSWRTSSRAMDAICDREGIHYLHVLQPTLHEEGSKPLTRKERRVGKASAAWRNAVRTGYPLLRTAGGELREEGVAFLDATQAFAAQAETLYQDPCHFSQEGQRILAERIAEGFLASHP